jgi:hypothetical protein
MHGAVQSVSPGHNFWGLHGESHNLHCRKWLSTGHVFLHRASLAAGERESPRASDCRIWPERPRAIACSIWVTEQTPLRTPFLVTGRTWYRLSARDMTCRRRYMAFLHFSWGMYVRSTWQSTTCGGAVVDTLLQSSLWSRIQLT